MQGASEQVAVANMGARYASGGTASESASSTEYAGEVEVQSEFTTCPECGRTFSRLVQHVRHAHPSAFTSKQFEIFTAFVRDPSASPYDIADEVGCDPSYVLQVRYDVRCGEADARDDTASPTSHEEPTDSRRESPRGFEATGDRVRVTSVAGAKSAYVGGHIEEVSLERVLDLLLGADGADVEATVEFDDHGIPSVSSTAG